VSAQRSIAAVPRIVAVVERLAHIVWALTGYVIAWARGAPDGSGPGHIARRPLLEVLDHILRLADQCPRDAAGDVIRRTTCELVESESSRERHAHRRRILTTLHQIEHTTFVTPAERRVVQQLAHIVRYELQP
jgi:hypothetical protein